MFVALWCVICAVCVTCVVRVCGIFDMCLFECQSVVNSNQLEQALSNFHFVKVAGSVSIFVVSFRFRQCYHLYVASLSFYSTHVSGSCHVNSVRFTTNVANCVSLRSSPVPSPALCVGSNA